MKEQGRSKESVASVIMMLILLVSDVVINIVSSTSSAIINKSAGDSLITSQSSPSSEWSYSAPDDWGNFYSGCDGLHQSPIIITPPTAVYKPYPKFNFNIQYYNNVLPMNITNNGRTVLVHFPTNLPMNQLPMINGGGLPADNYVFSQLHFHWGSNPATGGSEHVINLKRYPAEMHMVHFNSKYGTLSEAVNHGDGLAVLGIFVDINNNSESWTYTSSDRRWNEAFQILTNVFNQIRTDKDPEVKLPINFSLSWLLPDNIGNFYRYQGSLTTPGCSEIVIWTIFDTPITISPYLFDKFENLENYQGESLKDNYRPTAPLLDRIVTFRSDNGKRLRPNFFSEKSVSFVSSSSSVASAINRNSQKTRDILLGPGAGAKITFNSTTNITNNFVQTVKHLPPWLSSGGTATTTTIGIINGFPLPKFG